jgi:hypothetical protein
MAADSPLPARPFVEEFKKVPLVGAGLFEGAFARTVALDAALPGPDVVPVPMTKSASYPSSPFDEFC